MIMLDPVTIRSLLVHRTRVTWEMCLGRRPAPQPTVIRQLAACPLISTTVFTGRWKGALHVSAARTVRRTGRARCSTSRLENALTTMLSTPLRSWPMSWPVACWMRYPVVPFFNPHGRLGSRHERLWTFPGCGSRVRLEEQTLHRCARFSVTMRRRKRLWNRFPEDITMRSLKLLVIDDSRAMRSIIRRVLRQAGYGQHEVLRRPMAGQHWI